MSFPPVRAHPASRLDDRCGRSRPPPPGPGTARRPGPGHRRRRFPTHTPSRSRKSAAGAALPFPEDRDAHVVVDRDRRPDQALGDHRAERRPVRAVWNPGRLGELATVPASVSIVPGAPIPTASDVDRCAPASASAASLAATVIAAATSRSPLCGVASRNVADHLLSRIAAAWTLVPPRSMPIVMSPTGSPFAERPRSRRSAPPPDRHAAVSVRTAIPYRPRGRACGARCR